MRFPYLKHGPCWTSQHLQKYTISKNYGALLGIVSTTHYTCPLLSRFLIPVYPLNDSIEWPNKPFARLQNSVRLSNSDTVASLERTMTPLGGHALCPQGSTRALCTPECSTVRHRQALCDADLLLSLAAPKPDRTSSSCLSPSSFCHRA